MSITGAVKNNFGVVPGLSKPGYNAKLNDKAQFADMLLDLADYVSPRLSIMDAVVGMEGDGPGVAGVARHVGLLIGSENPLALDIVASEIVGLRREQNPLLLAAEKRGLTPSRIEEVEVIGAELSKIRVPGYRLPATLEELGLQKHLTWWQKPLGPYVKDWLSQMPQVAEKKCVGCGICRDSCPVGAIEIIKAKRRIAFIDDKRCLRCYCCHELCPEGAVGLRRSLMHRLLGIGAAKHSG
jgi:ferredoxin